MWRSLPRCAWGAFGCLLLCSSSPLWGQACCGPPTVSLAGTERGIDTRSLLVLTLSYGFARFDRTLDGTRLVADPLGRTAFSHTWRLEGELTVGTDWSVLLSLPVTSKSRRFQLDTLGESYHAAGIGDAIAVLKRNFSPMLSPWSLAAGLGLKLPTGTSDWEENGVRLPRDIQPGTGTWEALLWGYASGLFFDGLIASALSATLRLPLTADELGYRNGAELQLLLLSSWLDSPIPALLPTLALRLRTTGRDRLGSQPFPATGGIWLDALPSMTLLFEPFALRWQGMLPLWSRTNGVQLVHSWGVTAELQWTLRR